ncbi:hypothetical protein FN846DRAFT_995140 [Sphaerosporella brunnea]|uniref:Zn(2)-C6 fungal-type domain-containing protein n=1 Tax=Sphaerosporella brunnea TaxID=1250544 RepID=A0A5J5EJN9_9PEZI|nr:hypothetical protein FN846DRAFT_995140 [Sphaerosporella brunnea]
MSFNLPPPPPPTQQQQPQQPPPSDSTLPPAASQTPRLPPPPQPVHKRTYQACIPCRQRKVRCDLGSVEAPHDPPCVRCRRESKECFFSATRRKRTPSTDILPGLGRGRGVKSASVGEFDAKRARTLSDPRFRSTSAEVPPAFRHPTYGPIDPALSRQPPPPPPPPPPPEPAAHEASTTETLLQTEVYNSHEALLTLIEAAGKDTPMEPALTNESRSPTADGDDDAEAHPASPHSQHRSPVQPLRWGQSSVRFASTAAEGGSSHASSHARKSSVISPKTAVPPIDNGIEKAMRAWNKFRFVKAGWFTAREAIEYVEYFHANLHPLSPALSNPTLLHVSHPRYHHLLLKREPFLAAAILTVASRYMKLPGPGSASRSFAIHDMLWREVRKAFERLMWGGGWGGLGVPRPTQSFSDPSKTGRGLRTIGTVQGLLILTEWHVRGLHFPMDVDESDWGIDLCSDDDDDDDDCSPTSPPKPSARVVEGLGDKISNILEPAYRSDRMAWMLLGNALALAYELNVFDSSLSPPPRLRNILLVYVLQLASRLGWTPMIPGSLATPAPTPGGWHDADTLQTAVFGSWLDLTLLMSKSSELLFPSRQQTRQIMRSGQYVALLEFFRPRLRAWKESFEALRLPLPVAAILSMEYEHVRFYINSLALQAVIDRSSASGQATPSLSPADAGFISEVVSASRSLLSTVTETMFPAGYLTHAPVRIYLRILSAAMFLLKTFSLGAKDVEVERSLELMVATCSALRNAAVDDVHLALRFADLLEGLVGRVRVSFVKMGQQQEQQEGAAAGENNYVWTPAEGANAGEAMETDNSGAGGGAYEWNQWGSEDWLALPLDPILGFEGVTQGTMGVDVGGMDLLEVLLAPAGG